MMNDPTRDALWARVYADAVSSGVVWFKVGDMADQAVRRYDQRPAPESQCGDPTNDKRT